MSAGLGSFAYAQIHVGPAIITLAAPTNVMSTPYLFCMLQEGPMATLAGETSPLSLPTP